MKSLVRLSLLTLLLPLTFLGCNNGGAPTGGDNSGEETTPHEEHADHDAHAGHSHEDGESPWWKRENIALGDATLALGHHGVHPHAGEPIEPAVKIMRGDQPVDDAEVFACLVDDAGDVLVEEIQAQFHAGHGDGAAHYDAEAGLAVPSEANQITVRYRIVLADGTEDSYDVQIDVTHHD